MPVAEAKTDTKRYDLKSAPPDGYVVVRKFKYGERLKIRSLSARAHIAAQEFEGRKNGKDDSDAADVGMSFDMESVAAFQFARAVVEHNLTLANGTAINFKSREHFAALDDTIGGEIEGYIDEFNPEVNPETVGKEPDKNGTPLASGSGTPSTPESSETTTQPSPTP